MEKVKKILESLDFYLFFCFENVFSNIKKVILEEIKKRALYLENQKKNVYEMDADFFFNEICLFL